MITNNLLTYALEMEYPGARPFVDFWVGHINTGDRQEIDSEILGWEIDSPQPEPEDMYALVDKHRANYVDPDIRIRRDYLLSELDALVSNPLRWSELSTEQQAELSAYRQALLDVPQQEGFPFDIEWPDKPSSLHS